MPQPERPTDLDAQMLGGCSAFVVCSFLTYFVGVWPFFAFPPAYAWDRFGLALGLSAVQTLILTLFGARIAHMAGGCGCVAGTAALGVFVYLTAEHTAPVEAQAAKAFLDLPVAVGIWAPVVWLAVAIGLVALRSRRVRASSER